MTTTNDEDSIARWAEQERAHWLPKLPGVLDSLRRMAAGTEPATRRAMAAAYWTLTFAGVAGDRKRAMLRRIDFPAAHAAMQTMERMAARREPCDPVALAAAWETLEYAGIEPDHLLAIVRRLP